MSKNDVDEFQIALTHAREHFIYHAKQRLKVLKYFLVYLIAISAGLFTLLKSNVEGKEVLGFFAIIITWVFTLLFFLLEERNRSLVSLSEKPLRILEEKLANNLNVDSLKMIEHSETNSYVTYKWAI